MKSRTMLATALAMSMSGWGTNIPAATVNRGSPPPTRSRLRAKGMRHSGGTGALRALRSHDEQVSRIEAAQAKRERRRQRPHGSSS